MYICISSSLHFQVDLKQTAWPRGQCGTVSPRLFCPNFSTKRALRSSSKLGATPHKNLNLDFEGGKGADLAAGDTDVQLSAFLIA